MRAARTGGEGRRSDVKRLRTAVVGSGVAGLTAAYVLSRTHDVVLYEADTRLGGHAHTHDVKAPDGGTLRVDSGFIVHNGRTYPHLLRLFRELGVSGQDSEMSMSVRCDGCGLEYAGARGPAGLFSGPGTLRTPYLRMLAEVPLFHRAARRVLRSGSRPDTYTLGRFLADGGFSAYFVAHFVGPLVSAVWSCPGETAMSYPARYLFRFLDHHGLLSVSGSPRWRTVAGGSATYVDRAAERLADVRLGTPVRGVRRFSDRVRLVTADGDTEEFASVVVAVHPDQALRMLSDPTPEERDVLGAFRYSRNPAVLHTDTSMLPRSAGARASWNHHLPTCEASPDAVRISYDMNRLQRLPAGADFVVTLNDGGDVSPDHVLARMTYEHPVYTPTSLAAQRRLPALNTDRTAFAGAYHGWGFHEDGCRSGARAAAALGVTW
ncbi:FAD-dependent oxidoreductase [Streptomyces sp. MUM 203J]|uniref:NAD(P)/FAD-dependent oxidoreductase n=1 Tax=Streptomyces sp. MUM 203J TaxID=2791990 RepID=UPI001F048722|nr:FAD-dependent oxidoreductase [Streptomyces sp. MUM 203J]MCH0542112.1 FAD-dependent oxidoreductase [Streptomyces sp. MUM 203J]